MPRDKTLTELKHRAIKERYKQLSAKKTKGGRQLYTFAAILEMLSETFFLTPDYIAKIINK